MLTYDELVLQIRQRPLQEQLSLLEMLAHSVKEELTRKETESILEHNSSGRAEVVVAPNNTELYGLFKAGNGLAPTDEKIREDYTNYLIEKYK